jgi:hypothetical protein
MTSKKSPDVSSGASAASLNNLSPASPLQVQVSSIRFSQNAFSRCVVGHGEVWKLHGGYRPRER